MATYGVALYDSATYGAGTTGTSTYGSGSYGATGGTYGDLNPAAAPPPPLPYEPPLPAIPQDIYQPPITWRFILANSSDQSHIGELYSKSVNLQLALNKPGSLSFTVPIDADGTEYISPVTTCVKAYRRGVLIWSGPVWTIEESLPENTLSVTCTGWYEMLNHRYLRTEKTYTNQTAGSIALDLLNIANSQRDGAITIFNPNGSGTVRPTWINAGVSQDLQLRTRTYPKWQNIGQAIQELSEIENGFDFEVTSDTRTLNIYQNTLGNYLRRDIIDAQFGYNWGPNNLRTFKRTTDSSTLLTQAHVFGGLGQGVTVSATGVPAPLEWYGLWEEQFTLSDVNDTNVLGAYAAGEVALRSTPKIIFVMTPFPWTQGTTRVPEPFVDYKIGDQVYFTAKFANRISIERQAIRVYGLTVSIDENNNEQINDMQVSPT